jgi:hypothetical protein
VIHWLLHGHWPDWERYAYDFWTWRTRCRKCQQTHAPDEPSDGRDLRGGILP